MDALDDGLSAVLLSYMDTPRDAVWFAAVSKSMLKAELSARYRWMRAAACDAGALRWLRVRARRVDAGRIDCTDATLAALRVAHALAQETRTQLDMPSGLFDGILAMLVRDCAAMASLLKRHVHARTGGALHTSEVVRELDRQMLHEYGYDTNYDDVARASFAWNVDHELELGERGQLRPQLHAWQSADEQDCEFHFDVWRNSNNDVLYTTSRVRGDEHTTDWWLAAAMLYTEVKQFEFRPLDEADRGDEFDEDEEGFEEEEEEEGDGGEEGEEGEEEFDDELEED